MINRGLIRHGIPLLVLIVGGVMYLASGYRLTPEEAARAAFDRVRAGVLEPGPSAGGGTIAGAADLERLRAEVQASIEPRIVVAPALDHWLDPEAHADDVAVCSVLPDDGWFVALTFDGRPRRLTARARPDWAIVDP